MWTYNNLPPNTLRHWGIPGMKWGIRRYQNKDGTLTSAGKKRANRTDSVKQKFDLSSISDQELRDKVDRMMLEQNYGRLTGKKPSNGFDYVKGIMGVAGNAIGLASSASNMGSGKAAPSLNKLEEAIKTSSKIPDDLKRISSYSKNKTRNDSKSMTTQELRNKVNRLSLEKNYKELTGESSQKKAERFKTTLDFTGAGLALASSSLAIALMIKKIKAGV